MGISMCPSVIFLFCVGSLAAGLYRSPCPTTNPLIYMSAHLPLGKHDGKRDSHVFTTAPLGWARTSSGCNGVTRGLQWG